MSHAPFFQPGSAVCVCGERALHPNHVPCTADRRCMANEHDRNCPQAIAVELAAKRKNRDHCDACDKHTVVTDVWVDRTPMTLCQSCTLAALTAEGERLGNYFGWEIES